MANGKPRFPLSLSMQSSAPVAADLPPLAREEYLTARNKVAASMARKKQLEASLLALECELWDAEGAYLNSTSAAHGGTGSVIRGFDAYLKPAPVHAHGRRDRRVGGDRSASGGDDDDPGLVQRVFSNSSTTAESSIAQRQAEAEAAREKEREQRLAERRAARASLTAARAGSPPDTNSVRERSGTKVTISRASPRAGSPAASARSSPAPSGSTPKRPHQNESSSSKKRRPPSGAAGDEAAPPRKKKIVARASSPTGPAGSQSLHRKGS